MVDYKEKDMTENNFISEPDRFKLDNFEVYQLARAFRTRVYVVINQLPDKEKYNLTSQMRDAIISVSNNIAEAHGRWHFKESMQFCRIARGSTEEIIDDLNICIDENYYSIDVCNTLKEKGYELVKKSMVILRTFNNQKIQYNK
ncbi:MAG: four helix bundle protein [Candidatus Marinimicrobia bacterium]|nr:four helix bundle protein [Candidatus Neomarinimicrobiota bacterium]MBL7010898.1 four helix bundle protein [Candidatus Neomarinimicrobiota bacterium]MBL7030273.1 four helix bundle protein [Candidatus Neomarinimicrobiota bacterium]